MKEAFIGVIATTLLSLSFVTLNDTKKTSALKPLPEVSSTKEIQQKTELYKKIDSLEKDMDTFHTIVTKLHYEKVHK